MEARLDTLHHERLQTIDTSRLELTQAGGIQKMELQEATNESMGSLRDEFQRPVDSLEHSHQQTCQEVANLRRNTQAEPSAQGGDKRKALAKLPKDLLPDKLDTLPQQPPTRKEFRSWAQDVIRTAARKYPSLREVLPPVMHRLDTAGEADVRKSGLSQEEL